MAEAKVGVILETKGSRETSSALNEVGRSADTLSKKSSGLTSSLKKLGTAFLSLLAARKIIQFFQSAAQGAMDQERAMARLVQIATDVSGATMEQVKAYAELAEAMEREGVVAADSVIAGMSQIASYTKTAEVIGILAEDLADLAVATYGVNVSQDQAIQTANLLGKLLTGQLGAATRAGVLVSDEYAAAFERANSEMERAVIISKIVQENYGGLNRTIAQTTEGTLVQLQNRWGVIKDELGVVASVTMANLGTAIVSAMESASGSTLSFAEILGWTMNVRIPHWINKMKSAFGKFAVWFWEIDEKMDRKIYEDLGLELFKKTADFAKERQEVFQGWIKDDMELVEMLAERDKKWEEMMSQMRYGPSGGGYNAPTLFEESLASDTAVTNIKSAFDSIGKSIIDAMEKSGDAITDLRSEIQRVTEETEDSVKRLKDAYEEDLQNMARRTQENINNLDEQIKAERDRMSRGWRDRIAELEKQKAKENEILARLEQKGVDTREQIVKDELTLRRERYEKEVAEEQEKGRRLAAQLEIEALQKEATMLESTIGLLKPGKVEELVAAEGAKKPWGPSPLNVYFNFEGDISDKDELIRVITDHLNRLSELKQFAGE